MTPRVLCYYTMSTFSVEPSPSPAPENLQNATIDQVLEAADLAAFETWLQTRAGEFGFSLTPGAVQDQTDVYLETADWRFYRAGYALRLRRVALAGGVKAQLRRLDEAAGGPPSPEPRQEVSEPLADGNLETLRKAPGPVGQRLRALAGLESIRPLFAMQTRRKVSNLAREADSAGVVTMDEARVLRGLGQEPARLGQVRVKGYGPAAASVAELVEAGCLDGVLRRADRSKYLAGLEALALTPAPLPELGPTEINDALSVRDLALAVLRRHFKALLAHEPGTRLGDDPEGLHRMRVATRRLRAALGLFAEGLPGRAARLRDELRWVANGLGEVRDIDVQLDQVETWQEEASLAAGTLEPLKALLAAQRARARARMLVILDSRRYTRLIGSFTAMLKSGLPRRPREPAARRLAVEAVPALIVDRYREVRQAGDELADGSPPEAYHALRIRGKRLRYVLEFVGDIYGEPAAELAQNVVALQDVLGLHQDAIVATAQLRTLIETHGRGLPPPTIFAMGEIAQRYAHQAADCRERLPEVYAQVQGKPWKRLRQAMKARQQPEAPKAPEPA
jgi:CHAD domain-containing protein